MASEKASGNNGKVVVGSTDLDVNKFDRMIKEKFEEVTHSGTAKVNGIITKSQLRVQQWLEGHVEADFNLDEMPNDDPPNLANGDLVAISLYYSATSYDSIPEAHVSNLKQSLVVAGKISYSFDFTSEGTYTLAS